MWQCGGRYCDQGVVRGGEGLWQQFGKGLLCADVPARLEHWCWNLRQSASPPVAVLPFSQNKLTRSIDLTLRLRETLNRHRQARKYGKIDLNSITAICSIFSVKQVDGSFFKSTKFLIILLWMN